MVKQQETGSNAQESVVVTNHQYDELWRQERIEKKVKHSLVNGGAMPSAAKTTAVLKYDGLGRLGDKKLGSKPSSPSDALVNLNYLYNIRGWLLGINKPQIATMTEDRYFAFELAYDKNATWGSHTKQLSGNVGAVNWKTAGEPESIRRLAFSYDVADRLTKSLFYDNQYSDLDFSTNTIGYNYNGNLAAVYRRGWKPGGSVTIDSLAYAYENSGFSNKLLRVRDDKNDPESLLGDFKVSLNHVQLKDNNTRDYWYDANGNMVKDLNKDIATSSGDNGIVYNHLNLPAVITVRKNSSTLRGTITYTYDAAGNKLRKTVEDQTTSGKTVTTTTDYLGGVVYESKTTTPVASDDDYTHRLQLIHHEEGRIRFSTAAGSTPAKLSYDYFLKDHLGNVRMVLTEELESETYPTLTFEGPDNNDAGVKAQNAFWENKSGESINVIGSRTMHSTGTHAMLVRKSTGAIGAAKLLKVMGGDKIHASVQFHYTTTNANNSGANGLNSLLANIATLVGNSMAPSGVIKTGASVLGTELSGQTALASLLDTENNKSGSNNAPKAYLHILLFNEQFKFDAQNSKVLPVTYSPGAWTTLSAMGANAVNVKKNGYAYVYFSNESDELVYFDNFNLTHDRGPILEETHYYPFGLTMAGISSRAMGKMDNKFEYNGKEKQEKEFSDGTGLEMYSFGFRNYDPQIGRWNVIDPFADIAPYMSPYHFVSNNPINRIDPNGLTDYIVNGETRTIEDGYDNVSMNVSQKQFDRLQKRFDKGGAGYERLMNRLSVRNGYTTTTNMGGGNSETGQMDNISFALHKPGGASYSEYMSKKPILDAVGQANDRTGDFAGSLADNAGKIRVGSNFKVYLPSVKGRVFHGNQYVRTYSVAVNAARVSQGSIAVGAVLGGIKIYNATQLDRERFGYHTQVATAEVAGGMVGAYGGAKGGAAIGAGIGVWFGGGGAIPGAIIGGIIGGIVGGIAGEEIGGSIVK